MARLVEAVVVKMYLYNLSHRYDLPSMLDYVLSTTGRNKLYYVGHSMGTTTFMAMDSLNPVWADKVEVAIMLAPVAYVDHMASPIKLLTPALPFVSVSFYEIVKNDSKIDFFSIQVHGRFYWKRGISTKLLVN